MKFKELVWKDNITEFGKNKGLFHIKATNNLLEYSYNILNHKIFYDVANKYYLSCRTIDIDIFENIEFDNVEDAKRFAQDHYNKELLNAVFDKSDKKIVYIDMDNVLCDYDKAIEKRKKENPEIYYPQAEYGFFFDLEPIYMAISSFKNLSKIYDVWILTAPSVYNPMSYTEKRAWVGKYLGLDVAHKLILSPNKSLLMGHYLIDDIAEGKGMQHKFNGELIHFGSNKFPDWYKVLDYLEKQKYEK